MDQHPPENKNILIYKNANMNMLKKSNIWKTYGTYLQGHLTMDQHPLDFSRASAVSAASIRSSIYARGRDIYGISLTHIEYPQIINGNIHDKVYTKSSKNVKL